MINGTFKYPEIRFFGYLPKRIPEPSETRFSDNSVTYGFNDFMTQCRQSPFVRRTASPQNRIRDDPPACVVTEADGATAKSVWKQKNKSSTIKINGTMSKEIFVAFATQKGGIGKSTVTALAASYLTRKLPRYQLLRLYLYHHPPGTVHEARSQAETLLCQQKSV